MVFFYLHPGAILLQCRHTFPLRRILSFHRFFMAADLIQIISKKVGMTPKIVNSIVQLLDEGNTVPFIARYRKELTE